MVCHVYNCPQLGGDRVPEPDREPWRGRGRRDIGESGTLDYAVLTGMASGTHFFTIKAQDYGGKKVFAHFVVDVQ